MAKQRKRTEVESPHEFSERMRRLVKVDCHGTENVVKTLETAVAARDVVLATALLEGVQATLDRAVPQAMATINYRSSR